MYLLGELFCVDLVVFCGLCSWFDCSVLGWFLGVVYCGVFVCDFGWLLWLLAVALV